MAVSKLFRHPATFPQVYNSALDPVKVDPNHYRIEHENNRARVVRVRYGPRERSVMHAHPASIAGFLTDGVFTFKYPDGKTEEITCRAGEAQFFEAFEHLPESKSDKPFEAILIELKD
jgi:beta-alanine degradation protein BauB